MRFGKYASHQDNLAAGTCAERQFNFVGASKDTLPSRRKNSRSGRGTREQFIGPLEKNDGVNYGSPYHKVIKFAI